MSQVAVTNEVITVSVTEDVINVSLTTASEIVSVGVVGPQGIPGSQGPQGETGPTGPQGPAGDGSIDRCVTITFDGQGNTIAADSIAYGVLPFAGTFTGWRLASSTAGSIVVDIWKTVFGETMPTVANTITPTGKPTLMNEKTATGTFSAAITANDLLACKVDSVSGLTKVVLELIYEGS